MPGIIRRERLCNLHKCLHCVSVFAVRQRCRSILHILGSMRIAIGLLVVLAIVSVIGTVLTQQAPYANYVNQFGPFWAEIFDALGLVHVYGSAWFTAILLFLVISLSVCLANHGPKIVADLRSLKDRVQEQSLRAFGHQASFHAAGSRTEMAARLSRLVEAQGYRQRQQEKAGATLMTAKRGALNRLGYLWTHLGIIVICTGGLLDGSLPVTLQMWWFNKSPLHGNMTIAEVPPEHRLPAANPSFRAQAWVPEGRYVSTAVLNRGNGVLIQDLPFSIQLNQFIVEYYSTGMPKRFASDIVVIDHANGARIPARVEVNKPFIYRGIAIYQSSFEDGGSTVHLSAYPMRARAHPPLNSAERLANPRRSLARRRAKQLNGRACARSTSKISRTAPVKQMRAALQKSAACVKYSTSGLAQARRHRNRFSCAISALRCNIYCAIKAAARANSIPICCRLTSTASAFFWPDCAKIPMSRSAICAFRRTLKGRCDNGCNCAPRWRIPRCTQPRRGNSPPRCNRLSRGCVRAPSRAPRACWRFLRVSPKYSRAARALSAVLPQWRTLLSLRCQSQGKIGPRNYCCACWKARYGNCGKSLAREPASRRSRRQRRTAVLYNPP